MVRLASASLLLAIFVPLSGCAAPRLDVSGERAYARVVHQVDAGPRVPGTPGHEAIRTWIKDELARLGAHVEEQAFSDSTLGRPLELHNVLGHFGPASGRPIALLAHWDSRPWSDEDPDTSKRREPLVGANDGGSGVAVLLEVAELLNRQPPRTGVDLVFLDGEDLGARGHEEGFSRGAREYARRIVAGDVARPAAAFLFDMVGDKDLDVHTDQRSAREAANLVDLVADAARAVHAIHVHADPRYEIIDDHVPLLDAGIPAVDLIDFDYPAWHTTRDRPDQVSAASLAEVASLAAWIATRSPLARP